MRIYDGVVNQAVGVFGWVFAMIILFFIAKNKSNLSNQELSTLAGLASFVFLIQTLFQFPLYPVLITLSGIPLVVTIAGTTRGIFLGSAAMILNHIFIPGSMFMLGTNLLNMIITAILIGWFPSTIFHNPLSGPRVRYFVTFLAGFNYVLIEAAIVSIELFFFYDLEGTQEVRQNFILVSAFFLLLLLGLIEGLFTAIASSYYHRSFIQRFEQTIGLPILTDAIPETPLEKIDFELTFIEELKNQ